MWERAGKLIVLIALSWMLYEVGHLGRIWHLGVRSLGMPANWVQIARFPCTPEVVKGDLELRYEVQMRYTGYIVPIWVSGGRYVYAPAEGAAETRREQESLSAREQPGETVPGQATPELSTLPVPAREPAAAEETSKLEETKEGGMQKEGADPQPVPVSEEELERIEKKTGGVVPVMPGSLRFYNLEAVIGMIALLGAGLTFLRWYFRWWGDVFGI